MSKELKSESKEKNEIITWQEVFAAPPHDIAELSVLTPPTQKEMYSLDLDSKQNIQEAFQYSEMGEMYRENGVKNEQTCSVAKTFFLSLKDIIHDSSRVALQRNRAYSNWAVEMMVFYSVVASLASTAFVARGIHLVAGGNMPLFFYWILDPVSTVICLVAFGILNYLALLVRIQLILSYVGESHNKTNRSTVSNIVSTALVIPVIAMFVVFLTILLPFPIVTTICFFLALIFLLASVRIREQIVFRGLDILFPNNINKRRYMKYYMLWFLSAVGIIGIGGAVIASVVISMSSLFILFGFMFNTINIFGYGG